jgi:hypothetical protein
MPNYICKIEDGDVSYYLEWSTIVDAPVTFGMSLEEFGEYRGEDPPLGDRMERVEQKGVSSHAHANFDHLIEGNRAGKNETCFTREQIVEWYCRQRKEPEEEGTR